MENYKSLIETTIISPSVSIVDSLKYDLVISQDISCKLSTIFSACYGDCDNCPISKTKKKIITDAFVNKNSLNVSRIVKSLEHKEKEMNYITAYDLISLFPPKIKIEAYNIDEGYTDFLFSQDIFSQSREYKWLTNKVVGQILFNFKITDNGFPNYIIPVCSFKFKG